MNLVADAPLDGDVEIDIGRIHYHYTAYVGTTGLDVDAAYGEARNRAELRKGGVTVVVGAAGPMGQMHVEPPSGCRTVRVSSSPWTWTRNDSPPGGSRAAGGPRPGSRAGRGAAGTGARRAGHRGSPAHGGSLADDVVVTAPSARAVVAAAKAMAPDGMLVLFAGVPVGTRASLDLSPVFLTGAQYTGTSGSRISDQALVVRKSLAGQLEPRRALAAVGGMEAAQDALLALVEGRFPGKIVIFPALRGLPLTPLDDLAATHPDVAAALDADGSWTTEAEALLFARHLSAAAVP